MYDVITIGGATRDITFFLPRTKILKDKESGRKLITFPLGDKFYLKEAYFTTGGGASNVAVGLAKMGLKVGILTCISKDVEGRAVLEKLEKEGVDTKLIQINKKAPTGLSFIISPEKLRRQRTIFSYRGANVFFQLKESQLKKNKTRWLYISSLSGPYWRKTLRKIFNLKSELLNLKIAWNPGRPQLKAGRKLLSKYFKLTNILIVNKEEARTLTGSSRTRVEELLKRLASWGPEIVVITCGRQGAYVYDGVKVYYHRAVGKKVLDATGAGDAFVSGFLSGLIIFKGDIKKALRLGTLNGGAVLREIGAQNGLLSREEIKEIKIEQNRAKSKI